MIILVASLEVPATLATTPEPASLTTTPELATLVLILALDTPVSLRGLPVDTTTTTDVASGLKAKAKASDTRLADLLQDCSSRYVSHSHVNSPVLMMNSRTITTTQASTTVQA